MRELFSVDGKLYGWINQLVACMILTIVWFLFSIPIFTTGASTCALYSVTMRLMKGEEGHLLSDFVQSFKENFLQATKVWGILLFAGIILGSDAYILFHLCMSHWFWTLCFALDIGVIFIFLLILLNIFPLMAHFECNTLMLIKNSFLVGIRYLFATILMGCIYGICAYISICIFTPFLFIGMGLSAFLSNWLMGPILLKLEEHAV